MISEDEYISDERKSAPRPDGGESEKNENGFEIFSGTLTVRPKSYEAKRSSEE